MPPGPGMPPMMPGMPPGEASFQLLNGTGTEHVESTGERI